MAGKSRAVATTDKRSAFVRKMANGSLPIDAAKAAGFASPGTEAYRLLKEPEIVEAIRELADARSAGAIGIAISTCIRLTDEKYPPATQLGAAKTILEHDRHLRKSNDDNDLDGKRPDQMTDDQLMASLIRVRERMKTMQDDAPQDAPSQPQLIEHKD